MMHGRITPAENQPAAARYEGRRGLDPLASALVLLITVGLLGPLLVYRALPEAKKLQTAVEVVNLDLPPPPPPPASPPPPKPTPVPPAAVHAPRPLVAIPAPAPPIARKTVASGPTQPSRPAPPAARSAGAPRGRAGGSARGASPASPLPS
ncbi:MAG TPA: hypothetical protein PKC77_11080, partial [Sphingopyxis sp.]|nr:hypothetical protein [Sphingopyxis sp.]